MNPQVFQTSTMKVLHIIPSIAPIRGGPSQAVLQMVRELRKQGIEAEIATTNDNGPQRLDVPLNAWINYEQVPVRFFNRWSPRSSSFREFAISASLTRWLGQEIQTYDFVHIHAIFSYPSIMGMAWARTKGVPYFVRPLGSLCHWSLQQGYRKKQLYLQGCRMLLEDSQALHFTSESEYREVQSLALQTKSFVLPLGLNVASPLYQARTLLRQQLKLDSNQPVIAFLSRLHPKKGLEILLTALADLPHRNFTLAIAGSGDSEYCQALKRQVKDLSLQPQVHWLGFLTGAEKQALLEGADLFVLPSHSENFGISVLEAMASGLPVMLSPDVALSDFVQQHHLGWVVPLEPKCWTEALSEALNLAIQSPQHWQRIRAQSRIISQQQFGWASISQKLIQHYQNHVEIYA